MLHLLTSNLDWALIQHLVQRHRLGPLLYAHLNAIGPGQVPKPVFIEWWRRYEHHARRNVELAAALARVVSALERHGVPCVPYKGPLLAQSLYGAMALRAFDDIDLLMRRRDLAQAKTILAAEGYAPYYALAPAVEAAMVASHLQYHCIFVHRESGHLLEAHWKTDPAFPVERDDEAWWQGLGHAALAGERVRVFSNEEQLLMSCIHAMRHQGYRLCWIVDVAEALRQDRPLDWKWISARARELGAWRRLAVTLMLAREVLAAPLPEDVLAQVTADHAAAKVAARIAARLFVADTGDLTVVERLRLDLALFDRGADRAAHLLSVALEPSFHEWTAWPLPRVLYPLYLPMRLMRMARKYAARPSSPGGRRAPGAPADGGAGRE